MAPLVREFRRHPDSFRTVVCVSGQHREMLDQVLRLFAIEPDYDLNIMRQGQDLYDVTSRVLTGMRDVLDEACPDVVLVHGRHDDLDGRRTGRLLPPRSGRTRRGGTAHARHIQPVARGDEPSDHGPDRFVTISPRRSSRAGICSARESIPGRFW